MEQGEGGGWPVVAEEAAYVADEVYEGDVAVDAGGEDQNVVQADQPVPSDFSE